MAEPSTPREIALRVFDRIRARFPELTMDLDEHPAQVDLVLRLPRQPGLAFDLSLDLQNGDELHLKSGGFWCAWFPCTDPGRADSYEDAVVGLIEGRHRIIEHRRGQRVARAELQRFDGDSWVTVGRSAHGLASLTWLGTTTHIVQNSRTIDTEVKPRTPGAE